MAVLRIVQLTPPGRGAVATLLVEGAGALAAVAARFSARGRQPLGRCPPDRPVFGRLELAGGAAEEVIVRVGSPQSVEVHCHGGWAAVRAIQEALAEHGAVTANWRNWLRSRCEDPLKAAAQIALADARTQRTALVLLDQYHGALRNAVTSIIDRLAGGHRLEAQQEIQTLLARAAFGRHLTQPWRVVLAGPPNVGKSSLINALVGYQRAIVHGVPGTTRDVVTATTAVDGWPVELADTAGLRETEHTIERAGVELAEQQLAEADLVVVVFDGSEPWTSEQDELLQVVRSLSSRAGPAGDTDSPPAGFCGPNDPLIVYNKCDLPAAPASARPPGLATSALKGQGIAELGETMAKRLVPSPPPPRAAVPFTSQQIETLRQAWAAINEGHAQQGAAILRQMLQPAAGEDQQ